MVDVDVVSCCLQALALYLSQNLTLGDGGISQGELKGTNYIGQTEPNSQIFADFDRVSLLLGIAAFWRRRFRRRAEYGFGEYGFKHRAQ